MAAASPRASGFTSVIQLFRWYRSQGYSTLRRTCFFMRKFYKVKRSISLWICFFCFFFCLFKVLRSSVLPIFLYLLEAEGRVRFYSTSSQIKLVYHFILWEINIIYFSFGRVSLLILF